jgi:hypothetical protein
MGWVKIRKILLFRTLESLLARGTLSVRSTSLIGDAIAMSNGASMPKNK